METRVRGRSGVEVVVYLEKDRFGVYYVGATTVGRTNEDWNSKLVAHHFERSLSKYDARNFEHGWNVVSCETYNYKAALSVYRELKVLVKKFG